MHEQSMGHEVKGTIKIKIDSISLTLTADGRGHNIVTHLRYAEHPPSSGVSPCRAE
jgi:hypothetical protein